MQLLIVGIMFGLVFPYFALIIIQKAYMEL